VTSKARPNPHVLHLINAAMGSGSITKHGRQGKSALVERTPKERAKWLEPDLQTLETWVLGNRSMTELAALLGRPIASVRYKKNQLLNRLYPWTTERLETLKTMTTAGKARVDICEVSQKHHSSVYRMQENLGLVPPRRKSVQHRWSKQERDHVQKLWEKGLSDEAIARELPFEASIAGVDRQRHNLGLFYTKYDVTPWTSEIKNMVKELYGLGWSDKDIAARLHRRLRTVVAQRIALGLKRTSKNAIPWSKHDLSVLRELVIARVPYKDMIERLSVARSVNGLKDKARSIGVGRRTIKYYPWSKEEEDTLTLIRKDGHTDEEL